MIVRILGEGQFLLDDAQLDALNTLDDAVEEAANSGDPEHVRRALTVLLETVREHGHPVDVDLLVDSDIILPDAEATLDQIVEWIGLDDSFGGIIPERS